MHHGGVTENMVLSVSLSWQRIDSWLAVHAPASLALLNPPVTQDALESAQQVIGAEFPAELVESLRCHDGLSGWAALMPAQPPLSAAQIAGHWKMWMGFGGLDQVDPATGEPGWHPLWIPWAESDGTAQVIDLRPGAGYGRLGMAYHDDWVDFSGYSSPNLAAYLHEAAEALYSGEDCWGAEPFLTNAGELFWATEGDLAGAGPDDDLHRGPWPTD